MFLTQMIEVGHSSFFSLFIYTLYSNSGKI